MKTVIGLFDSAANAQAAAAAAGRAGVDSDNIKLLDRTSPDAELVEPTGRPIALKVLRNFALLGVVVFAIFGLATAYFAVYTTGAPTTVAITFFVIFVLIGLFCGLLMGWIKGFSDADQTIQHFREAVEAGAVVLAVRADQRAKQVVKAMEEQHAHATYVCPRPNRMQRPSAATQPALAGAH